MLDELEAAAARRRVLNAYNDHEWTSPDVQTGDLRLARDLAWAELNRMGAPLEAPGERLYVLGFVGPGPDGKVGRTSASVPAPRSGRGNVTTRIETLERTARLYGSFMVRAWISRPIGDATRWEEATLIALRSIEGVLVQNEYFYGLDFDDAVEVADSMRRDSMISGKRRARTN